MVDCCSTCTEMMSAPALAKSATRCSGSTIICSHHSVERAVLPKEQARGGQSESSPKQERAIARRRCLSQQRATNGEGGVSPTSL
eukprot:scaffold318336_cov12-Tisochrysis_lutea.AAC.1